MMLEFLFFEEFVDCVYGFVEVFLILGFGVVVCCVLYFVEVFVVVFDGFEELVCMVWCVGVVGCVVDD